MDDAAGDGVGSGVDDAACIIGGKLAEVVEAVGDIVHVDLGLDVALAGVKGLGTSELGLALTQDRSELEEKVASFAGGHACPDARVIGSTCGSDCEFGVSWTGFVHLGDEAAVGRIMDLSDPAVLGRNPLSIDEKRVGHDVSYSLMVKIAEIEFEVLRCTTVGGGVKVEGMAPLSAGSAASEGHDMRTGASDA